MGINNRWHFCKKGHPHGEGTGSYKDDEESDFFTVALKNSGLQFPNTT